MATNDPDLTKDKETDAGTSNAPSRMPLLALVGIGTAIVAVLGLGFFAWFAWLLSKQPAPLRGDSGWWTWLSSVNGPSLFDAARTTTALLAVVGIGGGALVAYRRQDTTERAHNVAIEGQRIANAQHVLDSRKYQLDRDRHQLETDRRRDGREKELRDRFASIAEQLGSTNFAVRHAGAYALASLADDWHDFGIDRERQVCINLLCAQLRKNGKSEGNTKSAANPSLDSLQDFQIRKTIVALIHEHRPLTRESDENWAECSLELSGADLSNQNFSETDLSGANLEEADLTNFLATGANFSHASLNRANLTAAEFTRSSMIRAKFNNVTTDFSIGGASGAPTELGNCNLQGATFLGADLPMAQFPNSNLSEVHFGSANVMEANFDEATLKGARIWIRLERATFLSADLRGAYFRNDNRIKLPKARFKDVDFTNSYYDETTRWPDDVAPEGTLSGPPAN